MLENVFYYFKFPNGEPLGKLNTEMYVSFEQIVRRRMEIYSDL